MRIAPTWCYNDIVRLLRWHKNTVQSFSTGFTIVELLVVVAIIGILALVVFFSLSIVHTRSRDAQREKNVHEIQNALGLYYVDYNRYPTIAGDPTIYIGGPEDYLTPALENGKYISKLGQDPSQDPNGTPPLVYTYVPLERGTSYELHYWLESRNKEMVMVP
ncbi:hypothetical protein A3A21_03170 [Candidatus Jorgensenbacteria bacterium RIFCSPLOWO2_01_FULL_45_25b]|uniref:Type II secretion system protein GspG C-terminal domain-containing protein n=1 Tax=Candidatus Jorgensenbacteria bacterium RIFCSPLOWO2_01_FULL_45_25b TaxID=1798471 RepID=A0A1F6BUD5_9BACT|nr:MAG: hypothetical protein A3A21_03170 [Candidatus Jorgensenbacteria bacterium RIFCSPLOWO2_01_FULL_45_25b]